MRTTASQAVQTETSPVSLGDLARRVLARQAESSKAYRDAGVAAEAKRKAVADANATRLKKVEDEYTQAKNAEESLLNRVKAVVTGASAKAPKSIWSAAEHAGSIGVSASRPVSTLIDEAQQVEKRFDRAYQAYVKTGGHKLADSSRAFNTLIFVFVAYGVASIFNCLVTLLVMAGDVSILRQGAFFILDEILGTVSSFQSAFYVARSVLGGTSLTGTYAWNIVVDLALAFLCLGIAYGLKSQKAWTPWFALAYFGWYAVSLYIAVLHSDFGYFGGALPADLAFLLSIGIVLGLIAMLFSASVRPRFLGPMRQQASVASMRTEATALVRIQHEAEHAHQKALTALTAKRDTERASARASNESDTQRVNEECARLLEQAKQVYLTRVAEAQTALVALSSSVPFNSSPIASTDWEGDRRQADRAQPVSLHEIRLGALLHDPPSARDLPAPLLNPQNHPPSIIPLTLERALLIEASGPAKQQAVDAIQALLFRMVAALAPGSVEFTFIDPISLGQSVAGFMALGEYDRRLVDGKAWTEPQHIEDRLLALTEQVEVIIQKNLRNDYADIEEYNAKNDIPLPYHVVVVFDFPTNLRDDALRRILSLATQGARCGFYPIILHDTSRRDERRDFSMEALRQACTRVTLDNGRYVWDDPAFRDYGLTLDSAPDDALLKQVIEAVGPLAAVADHVEYPFEKIAPRDEHAWWSEHADSALDVPLGPTEGHKTLDFHVDEENRVSGLIVGQPGSGKSTLLHTLLTNLALRYPPDDVRLYLVDMKQGVEFEAFARERLPHARVVAIDSDREFGLSVLREVEAELERRGELFRRSSIQNLAQYRRSSMGQETMPRILVAIDEFHRLFDEDDDIAAQASNILDHLVRQGRAYGIHLLLATQTLDGQRRLSRATKDLIQVRIALQSSDTDSRLALADDNGAARLLSRPGEAIYNDNSGRIDANHQFQVAYISRDEQTDYLRRLRAMADGRYVSDQIIFDGNRAVEMDERTGMGVALASGSWPATPYPLKAWVGEPVEIRDSVAATLRRQSGANLLVMGQRPDLALGVVTSALLGLAAQIRPEQGPPEQLAQFYVADLSPADNSAAESLERVRAALPHDMRVVRSRFLPEIVGRLAMEVDRRLALRDDPADATLAPITLTIFGLQSARDLRPDDPYASMGGMGGGLRFGGEPEPTPSLPPSQAFTKLLRDGPEVGIHCVVWCDTTSNLDRSIQRGGLREFALRVLFRCSREDSQSIVNSAAAETLAPYRALLYDDDSNALTKFRPYAVPGDEWLQEVDVQLRARPL